MKVLLSGVSSFTGYWFAKDLVDRGHDVTGVLTRQLSDYEGNRAARLQKLSNGCRLVEGVKFGDDRFLKLLNEKKFDIYCHHAAYMESYRSTGYDFVCAIQNDGGMLNVIRRLKECGAKGIVYTGSVFEPGEGIGSDQVRAFSPYGVTKAALFSYFKYFCHREQLKIGKFVIPNPFGAFEEPKFTTYLIKNWHSHTTPTVKTPDYVRDNIHVDLLARIYSKFCERLNTYECEEVKINPSQYIETQGQFAVRFATEMSKRLGRDCPLKFGKQVEFTEPMIRVNCDPALRLAPEWIEAEAWDSLARFYVEHAGPY